MSIIRELKEDARCICCGILTGQTLHLWEVAPALWCTRCYIGHFPVGAASGIFCKGSVPYIPALKGVDCMKVEGKAKVLWNTAAKVVPEILLYNTGTYCPVYAKMWEYPDGTRVSTTHLTNGRFIIIGPRLRRVLYRSPTPEDRRQRCKHPRG